MSGEEEQNESNTVKISTSLSDLNEPNPYHLKSPIDLNIANMTVKTLKPLRWCHYQVSPKKLKLSNTGKTVVLSAKWNQERPFLTDGPFSSRYVFSQVHFHWGRNNMEGSEHSVDGGSLPMELHAVHFRSDYLSQEVAMHESDGISILVYFFKSVENAMIKGIVNTLPLVKQAHCSTRIVPWSMTNLFNPFANDYFLYRGSISTRNYSHSVLWLISRQPIGISVQQVAEFRTLRSTNLNQLGPNPGILHETGNRGIYHVNPSGSMYASLFPISRRLSPVGPESGISSICDENHTKIANEEERKISTSLNNYEFCQGNQVPFFKNDEITIENFV